MRPFLLAKQSSDSSRRRAAPIRSTFCAAIVLGLILPPGAARAAGTWVQAPVNTAAGGPAFGLWLLTDGTVLSHGDALNHWVSLTPDKTGSYVNGMWKSVAASVHARGGAQQHILRDGRFFQAGGEFIDGPACTPQLCSTAEIYDPVANTWMDAASGLLDIGDTGSATLADGRILDSTRSGNQTQIYDPTTNTWTTSGRMPLQSGDENSWAALQNGGVLAVGFQSDGAALYNPASNSWVRTGPVPAGFNTGDTGGISLMFDGRVIVYGLGQTYLYTPGATAADPGTWALGPKMLNGDEAEDEYADSLPNGKMWTGLTAVSFGPGVALQEFDPVTNTVSSVPPPPDRGNPYPISYVNLPTGQVMIAAGANDWIYTPDTPPDDNWRPTVTSVVFSSGTTYTLTGTQLSGLISGGDEGDDMTMAQNYPIVWLRDAAGNVSYCRSFNFSTMMPSKGSAPQTTQFTTPAALPGGTYSLFVSSVGVQSKDPLTFTVGVGGSGDAGTSTGGSSGGGSSGGSSGSGSTDGGGGAGTADGSGAPDAGRDATTGGGSGGTGGSGSSGPGAPSSAGDSGAASSGGASSGGGVDASAVADRSGASGSSSGATASRGGTGTGNSPSGCGCTTAGSSAAGNARFAALLALEGLSVALGCRRRFIRRG